ncbi:hypothetical protein R3P38DRAFT_2952138 [Favolaschia claudopus]|uniref:F-box domain-containing protein n=1 Tax=Favolaschia claudopus TaxID=2862362 RepID=A0AAW0BHD5_9AGAR
MTSSLPPELLDAIVQEIRDVETLKECSLVSSTMRYFCQRLLLRYMTVDANNYCSACELLTHSPHVAEYVTFLTIGALHDVMDSAKAESFRQVLSKLQNVRVCMLDGRWYPSVVSNYAHLSWIPQPIFDFLTRLPLRELRLTHIILTPALFWSLFRAVSTISLRAVSLDEEADHEIAIPPPARSTDVTSLSLGGMRVGEFLARPQNISCVAGLRHLSIDGFANERMWVRALIEASCNTLEHIQFDCPDYFGTAPPTLPHLPRLRVIQVSFPGAIVATAKISLISATIRTLSAFAAPQISPVLAQLKIKLWAHREDAMDADLYDPLMKTLDQAFVSHTMAPCIHWNLAKREGDQIDLRFFADKVRRKMPLLFKARRLSVQEYVASRMWGRRDGLTLDVSAGF